MQGETRHATLTTHYITHTVTRNCLIRHNVDNFLWCLMANQQATSKLTTRKSLIRHNTDNFLCCLFANQRTTPTLATRNSLIRHNIDNFLCCSFADSQELKWKVAHELTAEGWLRFFFQKAAINGSLSICTFYAMYFVERNCQLFETRGPLKGTTNLAETVDIS